MLCNIGLEFGLHLQNHFAVPKDWVGQNTVEILKITAVWLSKALRYSTQGQMSTTKISN